MDKCGWGYLQIEVNVMPGKGEIMLTGQLGDVMKNRHGPGSAISVLSAEIIRLRMTF